MKFSERVKLAEQFNKWAEKNCCSTVPLGVISFLDIKGLLMDEPVIRCKDCKYCKMYRSGERGNCIYTSGTVYKDEYCSMAERRKDDNS